MKRVRNLRRYCSQRRLAAIDRAITDQRIADSIKTGVTIDADTAHRAVEEGRTPFEVVASLRAIA